MCTQYQFNGNPNANKATINRLSQIDGTQYKMSKILISS